MDNPIITPDLHDYWFLTSSDDGESWQMTDGPFSEREANEVATEMSGFWVMVRMENVAGRNG